MSILDGIFRFLKDQKTDSPAIAQIVFNPNFTGVRLSDGTAGVAMNVRSGGVQAKTFARTCRRELIGRSALDGIALLNNGHGGLNETSLITSLCNALSVPFMNPGFLKEKGYSVALGRENYSIKDMVKNQVVVIVGFGGNVKKISDLAQKVYVSELEPERFYSISVDAENLFHGPECAQIIRADQADPCFSEADTIVLTGCTLVTRTMEEILSRCRGKKVVVYGMTAGFFPEALFDRGVDAIATTIVRDPVQMMNLLINCGPMVERFFASAGQELFIQR